jgi:Abortive infection alpha
MADRLSAILPEDMVEPKMSIAAQAIAGLSYSLDEPSLKDMYLNLLATASDANRQERAHPSFAEIIKQLSSQEAALLPYVFSAVGDALAMARIKRNNPDGNWTPVHGFVLHLPVTVDYQSLEAFVDNWVRLGLVEATFQYSLHDPEEYSWVRQIVDALTEAELQGFTVSDPSFGSDQGILRPTQFGRRFASAVGIDAGPGTTA